MMKLHEGPPDLDGHELERISAGLAARGPDGSRDWHSPCGRIQLAHRRLAILDLSPRATQPMRTARDRFALVYNGEIYDYRTHRKRLEREGVHFRSTGDAEVVLELLSREGSEALRSVRGMYAFALWDAERGELLLGRDPYGIKPLYYSTEGGVLRFASQVKALEAGGRISTEIDPSAVAGFLAWGSIPEPRTLRRSIRAVPAGHLLRASPERGVRIEPLPWRADPPDRRPLGAHLEECVRDHLVSDVPVAVFLSAGLDSGLVAALARRYLPEPPTALTLTFGEARGGDRDEEPQARETARALGLPHVVREVGGEEVRELLSEILVAMDQPSIDGFNTYLIARIARSEGFKVALSGLGGDELMGGYPSFRETARLRRRARALSRLPGIGFVWPRAVARLAPNRPKLAGVPPHGASLAGAWFLRRGLHLPAELPRNGRGGPEYDPILESWERLSDGILGPTDGILRDPWKAVQRLESTLYLKNQLLRDADWAGMAHGVEIRVPLVDARLRAAFEARDFEPARSKGKRGLVRDLAPELPRTLFARPKSGFQLPIADWLDPAAKTRSRPTGLQSRDLAIRILREFDIEIPPPAQQALGEPWSD